MKFTPKDPPREFKVGESQAITLRETGFMQLEPNELTTFETIGENPTRFDVTRTPFGYYATNSLNGTLPSNGLRPALARNSATGRLFLLLVEPSKKALYEAYLETERMDHLGWLDTLSVEMLEARPV